MNLSQVTDVLNTKTAGSELTHEGRELAMWAHSSGQLREAYISCIKNMKRKMSKNIYDPEKGVTLWVHFLTNAMRNPDFKIVYGDWKPTKQDVVGGARYLSEVAYEEITGGEFDYLFQKTASVDEDSIEEQLIDALHLAGYDAYDIGEQWVAKVVSAVVEQIVNRPQLFQTLVDGVIDRIKARLQ